MKEKSKIFCFVDKNTLIRAKRKVKRRMKMHKNLLFRTFIYIIYTHKMDRKQSGVLLFLDKLREKNGTIFAITIEKDYICKRIGYQTITTTNRKELWNIKIWRE